MFVLFASYALCFWAGAKFIENGWINFQELLNTFFAIIMAAQASILLQLVLRHEIICTSMRACVCVWPEINSFHHDTVV